ncbi:hypothetical protein D8674_017256 [Pyrus ussuriensis x Pyrus communis]|uniref:RNase H type-1 domain-containing protein n=1 Tax=Pyrus ussuriensis x Pyrus communis TaxID=2448454 RepID=A0A5N5HC66_9ROSA|nr:hypothetical protein D8674_017256 [Pyrus ussuriensis x Pyrus communis]
MGFSTAKEMGVRKIRVVGDSNLVMSQFASLRSVEITLALYYIMAWKIIVSFKHVVLEHIPITTNRYVDALATLSFKLTFIEEQPNIIVIRREALAIDATFPEELSGKLNIKYLKEHINVAGTLYKRLPG